MRKFEPTGQLAELLAQLERWDSAVQFQLLYTDLDLAEESIHGLAAWFGVLLAGGEWDSASLQQDSVSPRRATVGNQPWIAMDRRSAKETVSHFIQQYHAFFLASILEHPTSGPDATPTREEVETHFRQLNLLIFGEFAHWSIQRWTTDWSSYFESFPRRSLWTLLHEERRHCVWLLAASSRLM